MPYSPILPGRQRILVLSNFPSINDCLSHLLRPISLDNLLSPNRLPLTINDRNPLTHILSNYSLLWPD